MKSIAFPIIIGLVLCSHALIPVRLNTKSETPSQLDSYQQELYRRRQQLQRDFVPARRLLSEKQVPFDPDALMNPEWRIALQRDLGRIPEMHETRYQTEPLSGVHFAKTLYLPEHTKLSGDTVIIAESLIFEGKNAVIQGNYNIFVYPIRNSSTMGTTLAKWRKTRSRELADHGLVLPENALPFEPIIEEGGRITIDTHGRGFTEWLQEHGGERGLREFWKRSPMTSVRIQSVDVDNHGADGTPGTANTAQGTSGASGVPWQGSKGPDGSCGDSTTVNGNTGQFGGDGGEGGAGGQGGTGNRGNDGAPITYDIPDGSTETYRFLSYGGTGGPGGPSGPGGPGGPGGTGGPGGDGADCQCAQGGSGNGGQGGTGGWGGRGGPGTKGGRGGRAGDGKNITVTYPCGWNSANILETNAGGGGGGTGGDGGQGGTAGAPGSPGVGGHPGGRFYCASSSPHSGGFGDNGQSVGPGASGAGGDPGDPGFSGSISISQRQCQCPPNICDTTLFPRGTRVAANHQF